jgi:hypothetical protein
MRAMRTVVAVVLVASGFTAGSAVANNDPEPWVVTIKGSSANGWRVTWEAETDNQWVQRVPALDVELAECRTNELRVERVACRVHKKATHRWLRITKRTLNHH